jgi:hypothetical protein
LAKNRKKARTLAFPIAFGSFFTEKQEDKPVKSQNSEKHLAFARFTKFSIHGYK